MWSCTCGHLWNTFDTGGVAEELQALNMSAAELARKIDVATNRVTQILNGTRSVTGDTALRIAHFFRHERSVLAESAEPL